MKTPVVYSKDYIVYLEFFDGQTFIHCDCFNWNKHIKKNLKLDVDTLVALHGKQILAIHDIEDTKHRKFLELMNFNYHSDISCTDGKIRQIFTRGL
jgi:hypothetical protein